MSDPDFSDLDDLDMDLEHVDQVLVARSPAVTTTMVVVNVDPRNLYPNPWNPNIVNPVNQAKLQTSMKREGIKRPIVVRERDDGELEIIGGQHRTIAAIELGWDSVPIINRGRISDAQAKKETLLDNFRYGSDDMDRLAELLADPDIGSAEELLASMPIDEEELAGYFEHLDNELNHADLDALLEDEDELVVGDESLELNTKAARTHEIFRVRLSIEAAADLKERLKSVKTLQGFVEEDQLTNDGDALLFLLSSLSAE